MTQTPAQDAPFAFWNSRQRTVDVLWIALMIALAVGGLSLTFHMPNMAGLVTLGVLGVGLFRWHEPLDVMVALAGMLCGSLLEFGATTTATWTYVHTSFSTMPAWIFCLWPAYPLCLVRLSRALLPHGHARLSATQDLMLGVLVVGAEIPLLCTFGTSHPVPVAFVTLVMMAAAAWYARAPHTALMLFISGVVGPFCEYPLIYLKAWSYPAPFFMGLPAWLPTGYALFGMGVVHIGRGLEKLWLAPRATASRGSPALGS